MFRKRTRCLLILAALVLTGCYDPNYYEEQDSRSPPVSSKLLLAFDLYSDQEPINDELVVNRSELVGDSSYEADSTSDYSLSVSQASGPRSVRFSFTKSGTEGIETHRFVSSPYFNVSFELPSDLSVGRVYTCTARSDDPICKVSVTFPAGYISSRGSYTRITAAPSSRLRCQFVVDPISDAIELGWRPLYLPSSPSTSWAEKVFAVAFACEDTLLRRTAVEGHFLQNTSRVPYLR